MKPCSGFLHVIQKGETLYLLSKRYQMPMQMILAANPYMNVYHLQPGDEICIPRAVRPRW